MKHPDVQGSGKPHDLNTEVGYLSTTVKLAPYFDKHTLLGYILLT